MHAGVTKEIGNAIHHHTVAHGRKAGLVCLGIAAWGCVEGKESLVKKGVSTISHKEQLKLVRIMIYIYILIFNVTYSSLTELYA